MALSSLGPKSSEINWMTVETSSLVRRVHISACWDIRLYVPKMKKTLQTVTNEKSKSQPLLWYGGCISSHGMSDLHIYEGTMEAYDGILERHMLLSRWWHFPGTPHLFQQENARPHSTLVTTACLCRHRVCVLDWPTCNPDLSPIENVCCIMKRRICDHGLLSSSSLVYTKNG